MCDLASVWGTWSVVSANSFACIVSGRSVQVVSEFDVVWRGSLPDGTFLTVWRPRAPPGFVSLGDVCVTGVAAPQPSPVTVVSRDSLQIDDRGASREHTPFYCCEKWMFFLSQPRISCVCCRESYC